ncbi:MAG: aldehyde ferredoxin oxidoreductase family protein [Anaerorhabdus sp.]
MRAYAGKIAYVDLTSGKIEVKELDKALAEKFIGGRGLGVKMLYDANVASVDPLGPLNQLILMNGPMTGTQVPTGGRYNVLTKSPLTNKIAYGNSGGVWGAKLKYAGWDGIVFTGKSEKPVYLNINEDKIELLDATKYWGTLSADCDKQLKEVHKGASVLCISPGGENLSLMACIMNDLDRACGRSGVGAVMGSKNLKAVVVTSSKIKQETNDEDALKVAATKCFEMLKENGVTGQGLKAYGTAVLVNIINGIGALPTKNWQLSQHDRADEISGESLAENYLVKNSYCHRCPIGCGRVVKLKNEEVVGGPEYEPLWAYGSNCNVHDLEAINEANYLCNEYGIDAISTPCTIATAMEMYQRNILTDEDCEGIPLVWGSGEAIVEWTRRIGKNETKLGQLMAKGSKVLCDHYGCPDLSISVKSQELPAYDGRAIQGIGLNYATSNRGGCHVNGYTVSPEVLGLPEQLDRTATEGKALWVKIFQDLTCVIDSMGMCLFTSFALGAPEYAALLNAGTGTNYTVEQLLHVGERIYNLERMFNKDAGMKPEEDTLPKRLLEEPIANGPSKGMVSRLDEMLPEYYELRGWKNAFPTEETIKKLDLDK